MSIKYHRSAIIYQFQDPAESFQGNVFTSGQYQCLINISFSLQQPFINICVHYLQVGNIIPGIASGNHHIGGSFEGSIPECRTYCIEMFKHPSAGVCITVEDWEIQQDIIVGPSLLHERLDPCYIFIKCFEIVPQRICRGKLDGGIEKESRPWFIRRRVAGTMIKKMVDPSEEEDVGRFLNIGKC